MNLRCSRTSIRASSILTATARAKSSPSSRRSFARRSPRTRYRAKRWRWWRRTPFIGEPFRWLNIAAIAPFLGRKHSRKSPLSPRRISAASSPSSYANGRRLRVVAAEEAIPTTSSIRPNCGSRRWPMPMATAAPTWRCLRRTASACVSSPSRARNPRDRLCRTAGTDQQGDRGRRSGRRPDLYGRPGKRCRLRINTAEG